MVTTKLTIAAARFAQRIAPCKRLSSALGGEQNETRLAQQEIRNVQDQVNLLVQDWNKEATLQRNVFKQKQLQVVITSPRVLQAGGSNSIQIEMKRNPESAGDPGGGFNAPQCEGHRTVHKEVLLEQGAGGQTNPANLKFDLPRDLAVKPGANIAIEVVSDDKNAPLEVREHLTVATRSTSRMCTPMMSHVSAGRNGSAPLIDSGGD